MSSQLRLLLILAHPDDESFGAGGVSRLYADQGAEIALVTATRGEAGKAGEPPLCSRDELPARREAELRRAADLIGIRHLHLLDYVDKHLAEAPPDAIRRQLVEQIRRHRPHIVITFDPNGINGHTDHIAMSRFTTDAVNAAADARWYPECGGAHRVARYLWTVLEPWEAARHPDLRHAPGVDFAIDITRCSAVKRQALEAHATQHISISRCFFSQPDLDRLLSVEVFRQVWGPRVGETAATDLLEGLTLEP